MAVVFFLICKMIAFSTFRQKAIFFHLGGGEKRGWHYIDFPLLVLFCLSLLVWVGGLDWSLCLTHGRHVSLES